MKILVVVDMVNGFINTGALADKKIEKITPIVVEMINLAKEKGIPIFAFCDCHKPNDREFESFPPHCIKGTEEANLIPEIKKFENFMYTIEKNTTNGFEGTMFKTLAAELPIEEVFVVGCCTDICVQQFVESYLDFIKSSSKSTKITVIENACYTFDNENHNAQICHNSAIHEMQKKGARIVSFTQNLTQTTKGENYELTI